MKPFDLEAALNGAKVVTKDGREVTEVTLFKTANEFMLCVGAVVDGKDAETYYIDGSFDGGSDDEMVVWLFMAD